MRLLLDTHAFLWWVMDDRRLGVKARTAIADPSSVVHVSAASCWEMAIKAALGRLTLGDTDLEAEIPANGFVGLPITAGHAFRAGALPRHHADPFDRMLVAQALAEELVLVTHDPLLGRYGAALLAT
ncbi:MAG TPA: type II toxin-antitoxin system VapC family toxin [Vicinamibacteria bacterium]|nr:type II toxin-antitoxin system VapC family toxin [Vicinamibacteria bacterium]